MSMFWRRKPVHSTPVQQEQPLLNYALNPSIEGCERGVVFYPKDMNAQSDVLFVATAASPTVGLSLIQQLLLVSHMRRAAWYLRNGHLEPNHDWLELSNRLCRQKQLPPIEQLAEDEALVILAEMVAKAISATHLRLKHSRSQTPTLPTLLSLLQHIQDALPPGLSPLQRERIEG
jgi:hypothetical protein